MEIYSLFTVLLFGAFPVIAQPDINNELAPNTFPNQANPGKLYVAPSDSIYMTDHNNKQIDGLKYGTYAQDTSGSAFKGITIPVYSDEVADSLKRGIIVTEKKKTNKNQ